jgi:GR25 family glycosyltransferase involved in LPS biosynthesis
MKCQIVYIKDHEKSTEQAQQALASFQKYNWDCSLVEGVTAKIVESQPEFNYPIVKDSRLFSFRSENYNRYLTKVSCAINHIRFWKKVLQENQPMAFIEHDAICTGSWDNAAFKEYLVLNAEFVFRPPNKLGLKQFKNYNWPSFGVSDFPTNYPLKYHKENEWKNSFMAPGTGAYGITPRGAQKMLFAIKRYGLDQSDFMINSHNIHMQYLIPSPVKFNSVNLSTSYGV